MVGAAGCGLLVLPRQVYSSPTCILLWVQRNWLPIITAIRYVIIIIRTSFLSVAAAAIQQFTKIHTPKPIMCGRNMDHVWKKLGMYSIKYNYVWWQTNTASRVFQCGITNS